MRPSNCLVRSQILVLTALLFSGLITSCQAGTAPAETTEGVIETPPVTAVSAESPSEPPDDTPTPVPQPTTALVLEASEVEYIIPIHIQHKTQDQLFLMFELVQALDGQVYWWPADGSHRDASSIPFDAGEARHLLSIRGLAPGQTYQIAVGLEGDDGVDRMPLFMGEPWGPIEISTLADAPLPVTIGVFGDSGFGENLTADLATQLAQHQPDFIVHTGDLVYSAFEQGSPQDAYRLKWYQTLTSLLQSTVIYPVVGNHELYADASQLGLPYYFYAFPMLEGLSGGWQEAPPGAERQWYALELGHLQMLFLNTQQLYGGLARAQQDAWLKSRLADERFDASIVVFHVPPFTSGRYSQDGLVVASAWVPEFEASNVVLVLSGHDHNYQRLEHNGITYLISGGGSSVLYPFEQGRNDSLRFEARSHFLLLEVGLESIELNAFDSAGGIFDSATISLAQ